jgi:hypothetical protein
MFSANNLTSANASHPSGSIVVDTTGERTVTVYRRDPSARAGRKRVRLVRVQVVRYVPRSRIQVRTRTALVTAGRVVTKPTVVTETVVKAHTTTRTTSHLVVRTVVQRVTTTPPPLTVTAPPVTLTETLPPQTVTVTTTATTTVRPGH